MLVLILMHKYFLLYSYLILCFQVLYQSIHFACIFVIVMYKTDSISNTIFQLKFGLGILMVCFIDALFFLCKQNRSTDSYVHLFSNK